MHSPVPLCMWEGSRRAWLGERRPTWEGVRCRPVLTVAPAPLGLPLCCSPNGPGLSCSQIRGWREPEKRSEKAGEAGPAVLLQASSLLAVEDQATQERKGSGGRAGPQQAQTRPQKGAAGALESRPQAWLRLSKEGLGQASGGETESQPDLRARPRRLRAKLGVESKDLWGSQGVGGFRASQSRAGLAS